MPTTEPNLADPLDVWDGGNAYRAPTVLALVGISYRQLDYWARQGFVVPSISRAYGSGTQRRYSFEDLVELRIVKALLPRAHTGGFALRHIRGALEVYRKRRRVTGSGLGIFLVTDGVAWRAVDEGRFVDLDQIEVMTILSVDWIRRDLEAAILGLEQNQMATV